MPKTPVIGKSERVDALKWCRCLYRRKAARWGKDMALKMESLDGKKLHEYNLWVAGLGSKESSKHAAELASIEALCVNESQN